MEIKLELSNGWGDYRVHHYLNIKNAYRNGVKYVERCNKRGEFATARILIYEDENNISQHLAGEIIIFSKYSGKQYPNGYLIPCKEDYNVVFNSDWAYLEETRLKVNKLFDEVR